MLSQAGVKIVNGRTVVEVNSDSLESGAIDSVTLDDGSRIPCNLVIVAIGVMPCTELVYNTGIKVNRGIAVDRYMATSRSDVYACGDVAEAYDFVYGENRLIPIWPNAYLGGRAAGFNMAGVSTEYQGSTAMNSLKYFGLDIVAAGMVNPYDDSFEVLSRKYGNIYRKVILRGGIVVGMVFARDIEKSGIVFNLMKDQVSVGSFKHELVSSDLNLAALPEERWRPGLEVPASGIVSLASSVEQPEEMVMGE